MIGPRPVMCISFESYPENIQKVIYNVKPDFLGIGSIIFRDEEDIITKVKTDGGDAWIFIKILFTHSKAVWSFGTKKEIFILDLQLIFDYLGDFISFFKTL